MSRTEEFYALKKSHTLENTLDPTKAKGEDLFPLETKVIIFIKVG